MVIRLNRSGHARGLLAQLFPIPRISGLEKLDPCSQTMIIVD